MLLPSPAAGEVLFHEDFSRGAPGWYLAPDAHKPYMSLVREAADGFPAPSLRVELPPATLNGYVSSPMVGLPRLDADYTIEYALRVEMPDSPFEAQVALYDSLKAMTALLPALTLAGPEDTSFRRYRYSFRGGTSSSHGFCRLLLGLPFTKVYREGRFFVDEVTVRTGREAEALELYLHPTTVAAGEDVEVHLSCGRGHAALEVRREADRSLPVLPPREITGLRAEPVPPDSWQNGAGWPVSTVISTGADWPSGAYVARVDDGDGVAWAPFVVRGRGGEGSLLVVLPTHTDVAYNAWGGRSFYSAPPGARLSFDRPTPSSLYRASIHLIRWLSREGIGFAVATDDDLHARPGLLARYPGLALTWHDEYWTRPMRENVEDYIAAGGSVLSFSGNTCWWQTRLEGDGLTCYKFDALRDPYQAIDPALVTTWWDGAPVNEPPTRFLGLTWRDGGMVNWSTAWNCPCAWDWLLGNGGYTVDNPDHWVLAGTELADGTQFGRDYAIVGYEVDGAPVEWLGGRPRVLPEGGASPAFTVLGHAPCFNKYQADSTGLAMMGIIERGRSFVFNGGTTGWCWGLPRDPQVQRVTRNLVERLAAGAPGIGAATLRVWPNPTRGDLTLELGGAPRAERVEVYGAGGRQVASFPSHRTVSWNFRDAAGRALPSGAYWVVAGDRRARVVRVR
jgi:hypothetical protein